MPGNEKARNKAAEKDPKLKAALQDKEFVPVTAEDIGVEAVDDYTFRVNCTSRHRSFWDFSPISFSASCRRRLSKNTAPHGHARKISSRAEHIS